MTTAVLVIKMWGVLYQNAYADFLLAHATALATYLQTEKPEGHEEGFPRFYKELARKSDMGAISDDQFYAPLVAGSGVPREQIEQAMRAVGETLQQDVLNVLRQIHKDYPQLKIVLVADGNDGFLQPFFNYSFEGGTVRSIFSEVLTSSSLNVPLPDLTFFSTLAEHNSTELRDLLYVDNSADNVEIVRSYGAQAVQFQENTSALNASITTWLNSQSPH